MSKNNLKNLFFIFPALIKGLIKFPKTLLFLLAIIGSWLGYQQIMDNSALSFKGLPQVQAKFLSTTSVKPLKNQSFIIGYSESRCNPLWVAYRLTALPKNAPHLPRPTRFTTDKRTDCKIAHKNYDRSGYDRGHLAPNHAISALYGKQAQLDTFMLSNISPQKANLNRKWWQRLEAVEIDYFTQLYPTVWVVTGGVFDTPSDHLTSAEQVEIPGAFYKIYAAVDHFAQPHVLAFLIPQTVKGNEPLDRFLVSVDTVEQATGLDFFHQLDDKVENALEEKIQAEDWQLRTVNNTPARY